MGRPKKTQPGYLEHKSTGRARVIIDGRTHYLGDYNSPESWQKYNEMMLDYAAGRPVQPATGASRRGLLVAELVERYGAYAKEYFRPGSSQHFRINSACRPMLSLYRDKLANDFAPPDLKRVMEKLVSEGDTRNPVKTVKGKKVQKAYRTISRATVNAYMRIIQQIFAFAVSEGLVDNATYQALLTVGGLRSGRGPLAGKTHEPDKVKPAPAKDIAAVLPFVGKEIATMIQVQRLCAMRPDEVTILRPCDIDQTTKPCWTYRPAAHKNDWREGQEVKEILIGPRAQKLLKPWLKDRAPTDYLFSPRRVVENWNAAEKKRAGREWKAFEKIVAKRPPRDCYDDQSYRQAVIRGCRRAKVPKWTPGQLRHTGATDIRAEFDDLEASQLVLGHKKMNTTEKYAEKNRKKYQQIMAKMG